MRLAGLAITAPAGEGIRASVSIALMSPSGSVLAEAQSMLVVIAAGRFVVTGSQYRSMAPPSSFEMACQEVTASPYINVVVASTDRWSEKEGRRRAETLVQLGDKWLADGNVVAAREFYKRSANMRWSPAAFSLGATYDPHDVLRGHLLGVRGDIQKARRWYARARELADMEASQPKN
jgi:TPR repeat protein